jgi:WD40 repeat protein
MAPEQIQGKPRPASDQYGLGVIAYEWLSGNPPFRGTTAEIVTQHLQVGPPSLREQIPGIPSDLEMVVFKALEKDPHRRFESVQEFAAALEQACQHFLLTETSAPPDSVVRPGDVTHAPGNTAFYSSLTLAENKIEPSKPAGRKVSRRVLLIGSLGVVGLAAIGGGLVWLGLSRQARPGVESTLVIYTGHSSPVATVAWSPAGRRIASGSSDQTVQVWDAASGAHPLVYRGHTTNINAVAWSPAHTRQRIASASGNSFFGGEHDVQVWDATTGTHLFTYTGHTKPVRAVAWSPDGTLIASGSEDNTVQVWDASNGNMLLIYSRHQALVSSLAWSPDGAYIASASDDRTVQVWNARSGQRLFTYERHTSTVNAVAWSPDGTRIASASGNFFFGGDHTVQVWNASTGGHILIYTGHTAPVSTVAWSPDSRRIASASAASEKVVHIWDAANGASIFTYRGHTLGVNAVAWSPDGQLIASASNDGTVRVWRIP